MSVRSTDLCGAQYKRSVEAVLADLLGAPPTNVTCKYQEFTYNGHPAFQGHWSTDGGVSAVRLAVTQPEDPPPNYGGLAVTFDVHGCAGLWEAPIALVTCGSYELQINTYPRTGAGIARKDANEGPVQALAAVAVTRIFG